MVCQFSRRETPCWSTEARRKRSCSDREARSVRRTTQEGGLSRFDDDKRDEVRV